MFQPAHSVERRLLGRERPQVAQDGVWGARAAAKRSESRRRRQKGPPSKVARFLFSPAHQWLVYGLVPFDAAL